MRIIAHRGMWDEVIGQNTIQAFINARERGFGIETDIRDFEGSLCISHDPPTACRLSLEKALTLFQGTDFPLAINIKADGLAEYIHEAFSLHELKNWFVFDMSVPDTYSQIRSGNPVFARRSEWESDSPLMQFSAGVWLDAFESVWYDETDLANLLKSKYVCVVSEELHGRPQENQWEMLRRFSASENLLLCTDFPERARKFFSLPEN